MIVKSMKAIEAGTRLFLAEGDSEAGFFKRFLETKGEAGCCIFCFAGIGNLRTVLKSLADAPGFANLACIGVMIDANGNYEGRMQSVVDLFENNKVHLDPSKILLQEVSTLSPCPVGIFISPGGGASGTIESLILNEIRAQVINSCIETYKECIERTSANPLRDKAIVQIYISSLEASLCGVGRAFQAGVLDVMNAAYEHPRALIANLISSIHPGVTAP